MPCESIERFFQEVAQDSSLQQQILQSAIEGNSLVNKVVELGQEKGYSFTHADAQKWVELAATQMENQSSPEGELNDEELEAVAGGVTWTLLAIFAVPVATIFARAGVKVGEEAIKSDLDRRGS